jgi:hypothetical protein
MTIKGKLFLRTALLHRWLGLGLALLVVMGGTLACDNDDGADVDAVVGEYDITRFEFVPTSPQLSSVNVLDTLVTGSTRFQLFSSGSYTFLYQLEGQDSEFLGGSFEVTDEDVRINGDNAEFVFYGSLLLPTDFNLERMPTDAERLLASIVRTVDLSVYNEKYSGLDAVEGTVYLELERTTGS